MPVILRGMRGSLTLLALRTFGVAADDLDLVGRDELGAVLHLERDVLDQEGPYFVAEAVRIQRSLIRKPEAVNDASQKNENRKGATAALCCWKEVAVLR